MIAERQKILDARVAESEVEAFATTSFDRHLNANANSSFGIPALMVSPLPSSLAGGLHCCGNHWEPKGRSSDG